MCDAMGDQTGQAYSNTGLVMVLYVVMRVSFCAPQLVEVSALRMLMVLLAFSDVILRCSP